MINKYLNKKTLFKLFIMLFILFISMINFKNIYLSKISGYKSKTIQTFIEKDIQNIKDLPYSKTLESILNTKYYNQKYLYEYINIEYSETKSFLKNIAILLEKGYNANEINIINKKLNNSSIDKIINTDYTKDIVNIITVDFFKEEKLDRYIKYYNKEKYDIETTILYVNIGLDNEYYTNTVNIENQEETDVLVNKYNKLQSDYIPKNLISISKVLGNTMLKEEAATAFNNMCIDAKKENIIIYGGSGYRSYEYQKKIYNKYVYQDGKKEADTYSARPGYSEHQTGLAIDIMNQSWEYVDEKDKELNWLKNNSYKYGFILRYPKEKENITGYIYEPWHFRYIGTTLAKEITEQKITYEEYVAKNS